MDISWTFILQTHAHTHIFSHTSVQNSAPYIYRGDASGLRWIEVKHTCSVSVSLLCTCGLEEQASVTRYIELSLHITFLVADDLMIYESQMNQWENYPGWIYERCL